LILFKGRCFVFALPVNMLTPHQTIHIIGQGLAGSLLAFRLIESGYRPLVYDKGHDTASSMVAAGMWNPVNFKRLNVGMHPERYLQAMHDVYPRLERWLGATFFRPLPIARLFDSQEEINQWDIQSAMGKTAGRYLTQTQFNIPHESVKAPLGAGLVAEGGRIDLPALLNAMRAKLLQLGALQPTEYPAEDHEALVFHCTGMAVLQHPYWQWLPMAPNKGQVLTLRIPEFDSTHIYHFGRFVVPMNDDRYKLGSTYELRPINPDPDAAMADDLLKDFRTTVDRAHEVIDHRAGYRPTTFDRMPIVGAHPHYPKHIICNGFGSRGVYYAPLCIEQLLEHLLVGTPLPKEISVTRTLKFLPNHPPHKA
jgi:glycine oxidase